MDYTNSLTGSGSMIALVIWELVALIAAIVIIAGMWKMFVKAGYPGWAAIIPIYNTYISVKIANRPGWWVLLLLIAPINLVFSLIIAIDLGKAFGKDATYSVLALWLFAPIGYAILGFGKAEHSSAAEPQTTFTSPLLQS